MGDRRSLSIQPLQRPEFWVLAIAISCMAIHLTLTSRAHDGNLMASSLLYWAAISYLLWSQPAPLTVRGGVGASLLGASLLTVILIKSASIEGYDPFLRVAPVLSVLGLSLLAAGWSGCRRYGRELLILCFLVPPPTVLSQIMDTSLLTAALSTLLLWYLGFEVSRQGVYVILPTGSVEVYPGCSGLENMLHLLGLSVLFLTLFSTPRWQKIVLPILAIAIAFTVNIGRVALLAFLSDPGHQDLFEYWHKGEGSLLFSMISVMVFAAWCWMMVDSGKSDDCSSSGS